MKPDFISARLQRGNIHMKQGSFEEAHLDYENILRVDPENTEGGFQGQGGGSHD
jgi:DnaJ family protein C protein 3